MKKQFGYFNYFSIQNIIRQSKVVVFFVLLIIKHEDKLPVNHELCFDLPGSHLCLYILKILFLAS